MRDYQDPETLRRLYWEDGLSTTEIAEELDCGDSTVQAWMDRLDIPRRDRYEAAADARRVNYADFYTDEKGYERWQAAYRETVENVRVHRLLAVALYGFEAVVDMVVHHENGVPWDNRPENLELMTLSAHSRHHAPAEVPSC